MSSPTTPTLSPLEKQLEHASSPEERLVLLNDLAWHLRQQDIPRSRALADEALLLAESEKNLLQKGRALRALGNAEDLSNQPQQALLYLRQAAEIFTQLDDTDLVLFAVADCTGHGVPGALMSMIGHNLLHQVAGELSDLQPGNILSELDHGLRNTLKQHSADSGNNDGMDILLCVIDRAKRQLRFSGSRRPLWLFRNGEATEFKGERTYVGGKGEGFREFTTHTLDCREGDWLYLFSDGFADQFGGPEQKKYQTGRFRNFLSGITQESGVTQQRLLESEFLQWKGDAEQLDDILVAGIPF